MRPVFSILFGSAWIFRSIFRVCVCVVFCCCYCCCSHHFVHFIAAIMKTDECSPEKLYESISECCLVRFGWFDCMPRVSIKCERTASSSVPMLMCACVSVSRNECVHVWQECSMASQRRARSCIFAIRISFEYRHTLSPIQCHGIAASKPNGIHRVSVESSIFFLLLLELNVVWVSTILQIQQTVHFQFF